MDSFLGRKSLESILSLQLQNSRSRFLDLLLHLQKSPQNTRDPDRLRDVLADALGEVSTLLDEVQATTEEIYEQQDLLIEIQQDLALERYRYRELFEHSPDGYLITDRAGKIEEVNPMAQLMLNRDRAQLIDKPLAVYVALDRRKEFRDRVAQFAKFELTQLRNWDLDLQIEREAALPVSVSVRALHSSDSRSLCWIVRDATRDRQLQAKVKALEAKLEQEIAEKQALMQPYGDRDD